MAQLADIDGVLLAGGWAALAHGMPTTEPTGLLLVEPAAVDDLAGLLARRYANLVIDGVLRALDVRPGTFARNTVARWQVTLVGQFVTRVLEPRPLWPPEVRLQIGGKPLRVLAPLLIGPYEGLGPRVLAAVERRRSEAGSDPEVAG